MMTCVHNLIVVGTICPSLSKGVLKGTHLRAWLQICQNPQSSLSGAREWLEFAVGDCLDCGGVLVNCFLEPLLAFAKSSSDSY